MQSGGNIRALRRTSSVPLNINNVGRQDSLRTPTKNRFNIFSPLVWKRSLMKLPDERLSLRQTFSLRSSRSGHASGGSHISFPTSIKKKKVQRYRIVEAKTGHPDGISFELVNKPGCFLRVRGSMLTPDRETGSDATFGKDATFIPLHNMWFSDFFAFESVRLPSYFIRLLTEGQLVIDKYDGTKDFKEEASFHLDKKPNTMLLKVDVEVWCRTNTSEYQLGKVCEVSDDVVKVKLNNGKIESCLRTESFKLVPNVIPCLSELKVGTRVISQWTHRDNFYPGVISCIRRGETYDIHFDDGDIGRGKLLTMRIMRNFPNIIESDPACRDSSPSMNMRNELKHDQVVCCLNTESMDQGIYQSDLAMSHDSNPSPHLTFLNIPDIVETYSQDSGYHELNHTQGKNYNCNKNGCINTTKSNIDVGNGSTNHNNSSICANTITNTTNNQSCRGDYNEESHHKETIITCNIKDDHRRKLGWVSETLLNIFPSNPTNKDGKNPCLILYPSLSLNDLSQPRNPLFHKRTLSHSHSLPIIESNLGCNTKTTKGNVRNIPNGLQFDLKATRYTPIIQRLDFPFP